MRTLEVYFRLIDQATAPARRVQRAIEAVSWATRQVGAGASSYRALRQELGLSTGAARSLSLALAGVGAARGGFAALASGAARARAEMVALSSSVFNLRNALVAGAVGVATKSVIDQVGFIEQQRIALSTILGSPIRATAALEWAIKFADLTPFETPQVLEAMRSALAMGFNPRQIEPLLTVLGDTASALALGPTGLTDLVQVFGQIRSAGKLMTEDVYQLTTRGIPAFEMLAKAFKTDIPTLREMIEKGRITSEAALGALYEGLRIRYGGGSEAQSRSIFGLISTLRSRPQAIALRLEQGKALEPFRKLLQNLADLTNFSKPPGSAIADRLTRSIAGLFQAAFGPLAAATEPRSAAEAVISFVDRATTALERVRAAWPQVKAVAGEFFAGVQSGFSLLAGLWRGVEPLVGFLSRLAGGFSRTEAGVGGTGSAVARFLGTIVALTAAWRVLNLLTLGLMGNVLRFGATSVLWFGRATIAAIRYAVAQRGAIAASAQASIGWLGRVVGVIPRLIGWAARAVPWLLRLAGPWGLVASVAIGAVTLIVRNWDKIREFFANLWASVSGAASAVWQRVVAWASEAWSSAAVAFSGFWNWLKALPNRVYQVLTGLKEAFAKAITDAIRAMPGGEVILKALGAVGAGMRRVGTQVRTGIERGMGVVSGWYQAARNRALGLVQGTQDALGVRSPSRVFEYLGRMSALGYERGLERALPRAISAPVLLAGAISLNPSQMATPELPPYPTPPALQIAAPQGSAQVVLHLHEGAIRVQATDNAHEIARAIREELVRLAMEVGHV